MAESNPFDFITDEYVDARFGPRTEEDAGQETQVEPVVEQQVADPDDPFAFITDEYVDERFGTFEPEEPEAPPEESGILAHIGGNIARGAGATFAELPRYAAMKIYGPDEDLLQSFDEIEQLEAEGKPSFMGRYTKDIFEPFDAYQQAKYREASPEERQAMRAGVIEDIKTATESDIYAMGEQFNEWVDSNTWKNEEAAQMGGVGGFFVNDVAQGFGSMIGFMVPALVTRGATARFAPNVSANAVATGTSAAMGSAVNEAAVFDEMLREGATYEEALQAGDVAGVIGLSEAAPIGAFFHRLNQASGGMVGQSVKRSLAQGGEEFLQEAGLEIANAITKYATYNPEEDTWSIVSGGVQEGAMDAAHAGGVGFTTGVLLEAIASWMIPGKSRGRRQAFMDAANEREARRQQQAAESAPPSALDQGMDQLAELEATAQEARDAVGGDALTQEMAAAEATALVGENMEMNRASVAAAQQAQVDAIQKRMGEDQAWREQALPEERVQADVDAAYQARAQQDQEQLAQEIAEAEYQREMQAAGQIAQQAEQEAEIEAATGPRPINRVIAKELTRLGYSPGQILAAKEEADRRAEEILKAAAEAPQALPAPPPATDADFVVGPEGQALPGQELEATRREPSPTAEIPGESQQSYEERELGREIGAAVAEVVTSPERQQELLEARRQRVEAAAAQTATSPRNDLAEPTDAQKSAGNYPKGKVRLSDYGIPGGFQGAIENDIGSTRSGTRKDGSQWSVNMKDRYGYVNRTEGADGDQVDAFFGDDTGAQQVYVIDQIDQQTGAFDEHKAMVGYSSLPKAIVAYRRNYQKNWKVGKVTTMSRQEFRDWVNSDRQNVPLNPETQPASPADVEAQLAQGENIRYSRGDDTVTDMEEARERREIKNFKNRMIAKINADVEARRAQMSEAEANEEFKYGEGDTVYGTTGRPIKILGRTIIKGDNQKTAERRMKYLKESYPDITVEQLMADQAGYITEDVDGTRSSMPDWGIKGRFDGPRDIRERRVDPTIGEPAVAERETAAEARERQQSDAEEARPTVEQAEKLRKEINAIAWRTGQAGRPVVLESIEDLDPDVRRRVGDENFANAVGFYDARTDTAYLIAPNLANADQAVKAILHEVVGHKGIRALAPSQEAFNELMMDIYRGLSQDSLMEMQQVAARYDIDTTQEAGQLELTEEYIAKIAEKTDGGETAGLLDRVVAAVRRWMRDMGIDVGKWTSNDIQGLLREGAARLQRRPLSQVNIPQEVRVRETGEVLTIQEPADIALRQLQKRIEVCEKLRECVA